MRRLSAAAEVDARDQVPAVAATGSSVVNAPVFQLPLNVVGQVNLSSLAKSGHRTPVATHRQ